MAHLDSSAPPAHETSFSSEHVSFGVTLHEDAGKSLLVTITPPHEPIAKEKHPGRRAPLDLCLVIDVSGSMGVDAPGLSEDGRSKESTGLNVLDVVKHACRTILSTMQYDDRLSIVTFTNSAEIVSQFRETTETGKKALLESIERLHPQDMTNLWDGLRTGMNLFNDLLASTSSRLSALFILTDGQPNVEPPRGHIPMLEHYLESHPIVRSALTISSFGFGYDLDSMLLSDIGRVGGGAYSFIPDAGFVGTVFVHAVANMYATYAIRCALNVEVPEGIKVKKVRSGFIKLDASWGSKVEFGDLQYGQTRDIILEFEGGDQGKLPEVTVSVVAKPWFATEALTVSATHTSSVVPALNTNAHKYHLHRLDLVDSIFSLCSNKIQSVAVLETATQTFETQSKMINTWLPNYPDAVALASDIGGEVVLALSEQKNWTKWGKHYFPALARAHQRQQCSNFKDAGLKVYGQHSPLFIKSRDKLDAAFDELPPPKPFRTDPVVTNAHTPGRGVRLAAAMATAPYRVAYRNYPPAPNGMAGDNEPFGARFLAGAATAPYGVASRNYRPAPYGMAGDNEPFGARFFAGAATAPYGVASGIYSPTPYGMVGDNEPFGARFFAGAATAPYGEASGNHPSASSGMRMGRSAPATSAPATSASHSREEKYRASSMASYNNPDGPCFAGECQVMLEGGKKVALQELKRGMKVVTPKGTRRVGAVVRTVIESERVTMCRIGELKVTPWHPVRIGGKWVFPANVVEAQLEECDAIYSVLLEADADVDAHAFEVEGITAVTLGHGLVASKGGDARAHPFFGSHTKVLDSLKELAGFEGEDGVAHCVGVHRDPAGLICGFAKPAVNTTSLEAFSHSLIVSA